jgi:SnoaL-like domain
MNDAVITGREPEIDPATPEGALMDFYRAFNGRDLAGLEKNWMDGEQPVMDNPIGDITRGWPAIRAVYERLVSGDGRVSVEFHDFSIVESKNAFVAIGRERGHFVRGETRIALAIRTSRWFGHDGERFRQIHHHGSIDDPELLRRYQTAVRGG